MDELNKLLVSPWGAEKWIFEGWNKITSSEKALITGRMDDLFKDGLPFELKHDKLFYIYTFSLLAQLEVLAIQVPLKFEKKMSSPRFRQRMRMQLLDEIFHGLVFTKIVYLLCAPHAQPPVYNEQVEELCDFIRKEDCPKVGVVLLNLIGEGWIEEIFNSLYQQQIAPNVFSIIINDEHRHVGEADLYRDIGLPDMAVVRSKLDYLETQLASIFSQYKYASSVSTLLGIQGTIDFMQALDKKHREQLNKINLVPGKMWQSFLDISHEIFPRIHQYAQHIHQIEMTPGKQLFMTQWDNPNDPTMVGEFDVNVSCLDFFNKKYASQTLTTLMLQAISQGLADDDSFRCFLSHKMLYRSTEAYVAVVVKLPECGHHIGNIVFENCHKMPVLALATRIRNAIKMMTFCYKKREQLEKMHPHLKLIITDMLYDFNFGTYAYPMPGSSMVTLSNIGSSGYTRAKSPLRSNESMKFTLLEVQRKQVWNKATQSFELQDILPVSISADHRIFDGNMPGPKLVRSLFQQKFQQMIENKVEPAVKVQENNAALSDGNELEQILAYNSALDKILPYHLEAGYKALVMLQSMWIDFIGIEDFFCRWTLDRKA
ncbi:MAG TPA: hypothetical protein DDY37_01700 [Legionella sp.]|nr:hypothetical protein [Legionella sp.]